MSLEHSPGRAMLRSRAVVERTGLSRTTIWRRVRSGTFPAPVDLGNGLIGWPESVVESWLKKRPRVTYASKQEGGAA